MHRQLDNLPLVMWTARFGIAVSFLLMAGCGGGAEKPPHSEAFPPVAVDPDTPLDGLLEVTFSGIGTDQMDAKVAPAGVPSSASSLTSKALSGIGGGLDIRRVSTASTLVGTRGSGGVRFISATYRVRNAVNCATPGTCAPYAVARNNVTLVAVGTPGGSIAKSAISQILKFDNSPGPVSLAPTIKPSHGMSLLGDRAELGLASLQVFEESETPAPVSGVNRVFPYGFVVNNANGVSRTLPANPAPNQFDGIVTFSFAVPLAASAQDDPFVISFLLQFTQDSTTRVTQSLEERNPAGEQAARARAAALNTVNIVNIGGCANPTPGIQPICRVRLSGDAGAADATYMGDATSPTVLLMQGLSDEFDGTTLDRSKWCTRFVFGGVGDPVDNTPQVADGFCTRFTQFGGGRGDVVNDEQHRYRDFEGNDPAKLLHVVSNGTLKLRGTKTLPVTFPNQSANFSVPDPVNYPNDGVVAYESAMISSKAVFRPGPGEKYLIEAKIKIPNVKGTLPQFWLYPELDADGPQWPPEIDIFEGALNVLNDTEFQITQSAKLINFAGFPSTQTNSQLREHTFVQNDLVDPYAPDFEGTFPGFESLYQRWISPTSLRNVWFVVAAEWDMAGVCFFFDGTKTACENYRWFTQFTDPNKQNMTANPAVIIINMAIGGTYAGRFGIAPDSQFPTATEVDWIRTWRISV